MAAIILISVTVTRMLMNWPIHPRSEEPRIGSWDLVLAIYLWLVFLRHKSSPLQCHLIVVFALAQSLGELDFVSVDFLVGNQTEQMGDAIETRPPLVIRRDDVPWCVLGIGGFQHHVPRSRIGVPASIRFDVHRTQLPLAERIFHARLEAPLLLFLTNFQPKLDQDNSRLGDVTLELGTVLDECLVLVPA